MKTAIDNQKPLVIKVSDKQDVSYCIPDWLRNIQIKHSMSRITTRVEPYDPKKRRDEPVAVVCFGPSLRDTWEKIKDFKYIITCSGAHKFLIDRGIIPTWHVEVDPRAHKANLLGQPHKDVEYWIASCCHKAVLDYLDGYNVKLWHVFDGNLDTSGVFPTEEWCLTGGCDVGQRTITCAAFNGFRDLHVFGMDGCESEDGRKHAAEHPNESKKHALAEYPEGSGKWWKTSPAMLESVKQALHELRQISKVKATFYGEGLMQTMVKNEPLTNEKPGKLDNVVALKRPALISDHMKELNAQLHRDNAMYGAGAHRHADLVKKLRESTKSQSVLDYGCGKGTLASSLPFPIWEYDPAIPGKDELPRPADLVICADVLEHIEPDKLDFVLSHISMLTKKVGYLVIHTGAAKKTYSDGTNTHLIQKPKAWWEGTLAKYFTIGKIWENGVEVHVIVGAGAKKHQEKTPNLPVAMVERGGLKASFVLKNDIIAWRVRTMFVKEPHTTLWIERMLPGEVMFDVGANIGIYSIWAATRGVKVMAFEPEAQNFAALNENIVVNRLTDIKAYPVALSNKEGIDTLYLSLVQAGASCHSIGEKVGPDLKERDGIAQGTVALTLDHMTEVAGQPDYIKVDVDGFEHKVLEGAKKTLKGVKSLIVEVNTNLPEHLEMVEGLKKSFHVDSEQVEESMRKEGSFKGCAEHIFRRISSAERHVLDAIEGAVVITAPFPHIYVKNVFPSKFYAEMLGTAVEYKPIAEVRDSIKGYPERFMAVNLPRFWQEVNQWMTAGTLRYALLRKFGLPRELTRDETLLIKDKPGYALGPHSDAVFKVLSAVFYLAKDDSKPHLGTSIYMPKDPAFKCPGGPHHKVEDFNRYYTMPYKPNSLFVFAKTDNSFHGVEKTDAERDVLIYDVRRDK